MFIEDKYIFHLHTNYTDGYSSVYEYCDWAIMKGYNTLVFTEHVRRNLNYDFFKFVDEINNAREQYKELKIWLGVEAKLLPYGELDIPEYILPYIQVIGFACHSFPKDVNLYKMSFKKLFGDIRWKNFFRVWVHPGVFLKRLGLLEDSYILLDLISYAIEEEVYIERNLKYKLPPERFLNKISSDRLILGTDAHSIKDLNNLLKI